MGQDSSSALDEVVATARTPAAASSLPRPAILAALVFTCAVLATAVSLDGPFIYDDAILIERNEFVQDLAHAPRWLTHDFLSTSELATVGGRLIYWRPLVLASYALDWQLSRGSAVPFHATNLLLHGLASALGFLTLRRWVGRELPAFGGALLFALHPAKAESVAWISGRPDLLLVTGVLLAAEGIARRARGQRGGLSLELAGSLVAYLSKEHAVVLPALAVVEAWVAAGRPALRGLDPRAWLGTVGPQLGLAAVYLLGRALWLRTLDLPAAGSPGWVDLALGLHAVGRCVQIMVWPSDLSLGQGVLEVVGQTPEVPGVGIATGVALLGGALAAAVALGRRAPALALGALLLVALLAPVFALGLFAGSMALAPRLVYLPLLALAWLVAALLSAIAPRGRALATAALVVLLVASSWRTCTRALDFTSEQRFWSYEYEKNPRFLPAIAYFVGRDVADRRPRAALTRARTAFHDARRTTRSLDAGVLVELTLRALLMLTADEDRVTLAAIQRFAHDLQTGAGAHLAVPNLGIALHIEAGSLEASYLRDHPLTATAIEAHAASRLGHDDVAVPLCRSILARCPRCSQHFQELVLITATAGEFDLTEQVIATLAPVTRDSELERARALVGEARRRQAVARGVAPELRAAAYTQFYVLFGAWGRAYAHARPTVASPEPLPAPVAGALGELAFRAGDTAGARQLLLRYWPPQQVEARFAEWARAQGWVDTPAGQEP